MRRFIRIRDVRLGIKNLILHGLRSFLTMLGMVFGVGSVVAMLSVGEGASQEALEQIRMLGSNNIIINTVKPNTPRNAVAPSPAATVSTCPSMSFLMVFEARHMCTIIQVTRPAATRARMPSHSAAFDARARSTPAMMLTITDRMIPHRTAGTRLVRFVRRR